jgi:HAMP domain-containing protein
LSEAEASSLEEALYVRRLLLNISGAEGGPADFGRLMAEADRRAAEVDARLARARSLLAAEIADPTSFSDKVLLGRLDTRLEYIQRERTSYEKTRALLKPGSIAQERREMQSAVAELEEKRDALNQETAAVRAEMLRLLDRAVGMIIEAQQSATRYGVLLLAAALGIGLVVAATVTVNLVRPLRRLVRGAVAVQHGSLDTELPITTRDEVGALTMAFNQMIRELRTKERVRETFGKYVDPRRGEVAQAKLDLEVEFAAGLAAYRALKWSDAEAAFLRCLDLVPDDGPAHVFRRRVEQFRHAPPPEGWKAVWQLGDK